MHLGLDIKDRRYRVKIYKSCFVGNQCVAWLIENKIAENEQKAVEIGNQLMDRGIIAHVTKDHRFLNKNYFYKFNKQKMAQEQSNNIQKEEDSAVSEGFNEVKTPQAARLLKLLDWHFKIGSKYIPGPYSGRVSLIRCTK